MKTLILMRHAEAMNADHGNADHERRLTPKGILQATAMADLIHTFQPIELWVSSAQRTRETAALVLKKNMDTISGSRLLYNAADYEILHFIQENAQEDTIMIVAHNPGISQIHYSLTQQWIDFSPSGMAIIKIPIDHWSSLKKGSAFLSTFIPPKSI
jgi:phosphohistidine phosphatase